MSFYYGTGSNSTKILKNILNNYEKEIIKNIVDKLDNSNTRMEIQKTRKFQYIPFEGHQSRLGHYFRHLYQTINYVDKQDLDIDKYDYIKILRAQLSISEEALLMFYSISRLGVNWENKKLITKYRLIKHIPNEFFDTCNEINIKDYFPDLIFRWEENIEYNK